jgi:hypothetical protein
MNEWANDLKWMIQNEITLDRPSVQASDRAVRRRSSRTGGRSLQNGLPSARRHERCWTPLGDTGWNQKLGLAMRRALGEKVWKIKWAYRQRRQQAFADKWNRGWSMNVMHAQMSVWMNESNLNESSWVRAKEPEKMNDTTKITTRITCVSQQFTQVEETQAISADAACDLIADGPSADH